MDQKSGGKTLTVRIGKTVDLASSSPKVQIRDGIVGEDFVAGAHEER